MRALAVLVHVFTALGAVCALFAMQAVMAGDARLVFIWLAVALVVDAVDGTFARWVDVTQHLPRFSGERLDLVIDYVTYVFVPVLALLVFGYLEGLLGNGIAAGILLSSLFHFADRNSKTNDNCFVGFPAIWNIFAFYVFAFSLPPAFTAGAAAVAIAATFVPMPWVHPLRVTRLRPVTLAVTAIASVAGCLLLARGFPADGISQSALALAAIYYVGLSIFWWVLSSVKPERAS